MAKKEILRKISCLFFHANIICFFKVIWNRCMFMPILTHSQIGYKW